MNVFDFQMLINTILFALLLHAYEVSNQEQVSSQSTSQEHSEDDLMPESDVEWQQPEENKPNKPNPLMLILPKMATVINFNLPEAFRIDGQNFKSGVSKAAPTNQLNPANANFLFNNLVRAAESYLSAITNGVKAEDTNKMASVPNPTLELFRKARNQMMTTKNQNNQPSIPENPDIKSTNTRFPNQSQSSILNQDQFAYWDAPSEYLQQATPDDKTKIQNSVL